MRAEPRRAESRPANHAGRPKLRVLGPEDRPRRAEVRRQRRAASPRRDRSAGIVLMTTGLLVGAGLVMVLSASSVSSFQANGSSFTFFRRQLVYALIGSGALFVTLRMRVAAWQRLGLPADGHLRAAAPAVLIPGVGTRAGGSVRWIAIGPVSRAAVRARQARGRRPHRDGRSAGSGSCWPTRSSGDAAAADRRVRLRVGDPPARPGNDARPRGHGLPDAVRGGSAPAPPGGVRRPRRLARPSA